MKIGFASIYPYRPHLKHMVFLVQQAKLLGHQINFLEINNGFENIFPKLEENFIKRTIASLKIKYAGLNGFLNESPDYINNYIKKTGYEIDSSKFMYSAQSTVAGKFGICDEKDLHSKKIQKSIKKNLIDIKTAYKASIEWLEIEHFDMVIGFNGRVDITNSIMQACIDRDVPYFSLERSWTGEGIQLIGNGTPLSLSSIHSLVEPWNYKPLKNYQIVKAYSFLANRFSKQASGEFRQWNKSQELGLINENISWLYMPSSIFERIGHPDWEVEWKNDIEAVESLLKMKSINPSNLVVRGHPQWIMVSPESERLYSEWCKKIGAKYIESSSKINSQELILRSDNIISYGSTATFEAGIMGKNIYNLSPSFYDKSGFINNIFSKTTNINEVELSLSKKDIARLCLRCLYAINYRHMKLTNEIKAVNAFDYVFRDIKNIDFFFKLLENKNFSNDEDFAESTKDEDEFLDLLFNNIHNNIFDKSFIHNYKNNNDLYDMEFKNNQDYKVINRIGIWKFLDLFDKYVR